jgi:hypothetical protein
MTESGHSALSYEHAGKIEAQLRAEVADLLARAEAADQADGVDGMSIPEELARREDRLAKLAEARAKECFEREMAEHNAKLACSGSLALASLNRTCRNHVPTFPQRSLPWLLTRAACGGLRSASDCRTRRALLHLSYSYAAPFGLALLVTQNPLLPCWITYPHYLVGIEGDRRSIVNNVGQLNKGCHIHYLSRKWVDQYYHFSYFVGFDC